MFFVDVKFLNRISCDFTLFSDVSKLNLNSTFDTKNVFARFGGSSLLDAFKFMLLHFHPIQTRHVILTTVSNSFLLFPVLFFIHDTKVQLS